MKMSSIKAPMTTQTTTPPKRSARMRGAGFTPECQSGSAGRGVLSEKGISRYAAAAKSPKFNASFVSNYVYDLLRHELF